MKVTVRSTERIVLVTPEGGTGRIEARVWEGETETGIPVVLLVPRVAVPLELDGHPVDQSTFLEELKEHSPPTELGSAFPLRMVI